jgi:hypothetical protein
MVDIFIRYERSDHARAQRIAEALGQFGWSVWWDRMLLAGNRFDATIQQALDASRCVIVLWSKTSISSDWVKDEASVGAKRGILVPVLIDKVEIPIGFRQIHTARLTNWESSSLPPEFRDVTDSVTQLLNRFRAQETTRAPASPPIETPVTPVREQAENSIRFSVPYVPDKQEHKLQRRPVLLSRFFTLLAVIGIVCGGLGALWYGHRHGTPQPPKGDNMQSPPKLTSETSSPNPQGSVAQQAASTTITGPKVSTGSASAGGIAIGTFEFPWPGGDLWDIYRGEKLVATRMGSAEQALQAGTYTIKPHSDNVFAPFDISIKSGATTKIEIGGIFEFNWPGGDLWDIYRGKKLVATRMGSAEQALQAGTYTIKPHSDNVFSPFDVQITDGHKSKVP